MSKTCESCRHWLSPSERTGYGDVIQFAPNTSQPWSVDDFQRTRTLQHEADQLFGECQIINLEAAIDVTEGDPIPLAVALDGSEYKANLFTQGSFGCVLHAEG